MERFKSRSHFIIPILLRSERSKFPIKAVMLNISSKGLRVFSNDRRLLLMDETLLANREFDLDFDFFDIPTTDMKVKIVNVSAGANRDYEKQLGLEFVGLDPEIAERINRFVQEHSGP